MPGDMTMEWPDSWVVRVDLNDQVPVRWKHVHISSLGIVRIDDLAIPLPRARGQNKHVVAVHVHRMWNTPKWAVVPNDESHSPIISEVVHVPLRIKRVGSIPLVGKE